MTEDERKELVRRLLSWHTPGETITGDVGLYLEAAAEIERLSADFATLQRNMNVAEAALAASEAKVGELRKALQAIVNDIKAGDDQTAYAIARTAMLGE